MKNIILIGACLLFIFSCKKLEDTASTDIQETAQQIGESMASVDEAGGSSGSIATFEKSMQKTFERYSPTEINSSHAIASLLVNKAEAVSCFGFGFGSCSSNTIVRNFSDCTVGSATLSGDVTLVWGGGAAACTLSSAGQTITRSPNFTLTGRRSATLAVTKTGSIGQRLTWSSGSGTSKVFAFSNDGINRKFTLANATVLFDQTTVVSGSLTVTGTSRASRVMTASAGNLLRVTNNLTSVSCNYTPTNVTWSSTSCNCPVAGSWAGSCSDGKTTTLDITGCGTGTYTEGTETQSVSFDRCSAS